MLALATALVLWGLKDTAQICLHPCSHCSVISTSFFRTALHGHQGNSTAQKVKTTTYTKDFSPAMQWHASQVFKTATGQNERLVNFFLFQLKEEGFEMLWRVPPSSPDLTVSAGWCMTACAEEERTPVNEMWLQRVSGLSFLWSGCISCLDGLHLVPL